MSTASDASVRPQVTFSQKGNGASVVDCTGKAFMVRLNGVWRWQSACGERVGYAYSPSQAINELHRHEFGCFACRGVLEGDDEE